MNLIELDVVKNEIVPEAKQNLPRIYQEPHQNQPRIDPESIRNWPTIRPQVDCADFVLVGNNFVDYPFFTEP